MGSSQVECLRIEIREKMRRWLYREWEAWRVEYVAKNYPHTYQVYISVFLD